MRAAGDRDDTLPSGISTQCDVLNGEIERLDRQGSIDRAIVRGGNCQDRLRIVTE